jgi:predicted Zn-dependent protease with MMP-like domain
MNERIEKLGEQADLLGEFTPTKIPGRYVGYITEEQILKFAELLVKECIEQVWYTREDGINGNISQVIKDRIKQHFGVEE